MHRAPFGWGVPSAFYEDMAERFRTAIAALVRKVSISNYKFTNYVRKEATGWSSLTSGVKQNFVSMDTVFTVHLRLDGETVITTLMPGVSGENSVWTIPASWFLGAGKTFGEGAVKNASEVAIDGATALPDGTGLNLTITLPSSLVQSVAGTTQDIEVFVDMVAQESQDPQITVSIVDASDNAVVENSFSVTWIKEHFFMG